MEKLFVNEQDKKPATKVEILAPNGLGFGEGSINADRIDLSVEELQEIKRVILSPDEILVDVDLGDDGQVLDDDGCGDGRGVGKTFSKLNPGFKRSLNRAKVFGGSVAMTVASEIANSEADENLLSAYTTAISSLRSKMIDFGGHTDNHAHGNNCGCGAIDKAPVIINAASKYSGQISEVMVGALGINNDLTNAVLAKYDDYGQRMKTDNYSGSAVMENIIESGVVVKELEAYSRH